MALSRTKSALSLTGRSPLKVWNTTEKRRLNEGIISGNPMFDICRIVYPFCDPDVRRETEATLVEDYYDRLKTLMSAEGRLLDLSIEQVSIGCGILKVTKDLAARGLCPLRGAPNDGTGHSATILHRAQAGRVLQ